MTRHLLPVDLAGAPLAGPREPFIADLPALEPRRRVHNASLVGERFGRLAVVRRAENVGQRVAWHCICDCGAQCIETGSRLRAGKVVSCGSCTPRFVAKHEMDGGRLTAAYLQSILDYDPKTGVFRWKVKLARANPGDVAGRINSNGYWRISIQRRDYGAHRLAWLYVYGRLPERQLDHINGDRLDNRLANLREATHSQNMQNLKRFRNNTSGYQGVRKHKGKWQARICVDRHVHHLGSFRTAEDAAAAYAEAKARLHTFSPTARFPVVHCSQCGAAFPDRDNGFSSCAAHAHLTPASMFDRRTW